MLLCHFYRGLSGAHSKRKINKIEMLQRRVARWVCNDYSPNSSMTDMLYNFGLQSLELQLFSMPVQMHRKSYCIPPALALVWTKCLSITLKFFEVMDKALLGKLSCTQTGLVYLALLHFFTSLPNTSCAHI